MALTPTTASSDTFYDSGAVKVILSNSSNDYYLFDSIENTTDEPLYLVFQLMPVKKSGSGIDGVHQAQNNYIQGWYGTGTSYTSPGVSVITYVYRNEAAPTTDTDKELDKTTSTETLYCCNVYHAYRHHTSRKHTAAFAVLAPGETMTCHYYQTSSATSTSDAVVRLYAVTHSEFYS